MPKVALRSKRGSPPEHIDKAREPFGGGFVVPGMETQPLRKISHWIFNAPTDAPAATLLVRLMAGGVFLSEGILKFVYTNQGVGRFTKLGLPLPELTANFIGCLEIVGGLMLLTGLLTRAIAIPFIIEMIVAMLATKVGLYFGTSPLPMPPSPPKVGFWAVMHEIRSDYAQIMCSWFLLVVGPGPWSLDAYLQRRSAKSGARSAVVQKYA